MLCGSRPQAGLRAMKEVHGLSDKTWPTRRGSSFPIGRSRTVSFLSSRCTPVRDILQLQML